MDIDKIIEKMREKQVNPKQICNWDNGEEVQRLMIELKQMQLSLENQICQSIQSHLMGKQKTLNIMKQTVPLLEKQKIRAKEPEQEIINIIQMVQIKNKIDFTLKKVGTMMDSKQN